MTKNKNKQKKIGIISHETSTKKLIVPTKNTYRLGSIVTNNKQEAIGRINDIIGSTKKPYISIKTNNKFKKAKVGETVYLIPNQKKGGCKHGRNTKKKKKNRKTTQNNQKTKNKIKT